MGQHADTEPPRRRGSFTHLLIVWLLVGSTLCGLGLALVDVIPVTVPISSVGAGVLFGTVLITSLWIAGFRPSFRASGGYFLLANGLQFLMLVSSPFVLPSGASLSAWQAVLLRGLSIALAAVLVFTDPGRRVRRFVRAQGRELAKTPPE